MLATIKREHREIPIGLLDPPRNPSRVGMDDAALDELADSIRRNGLIQELIVARLGERYEIVAGHRRSICAARAGLVAVECCVYPSYEAALIAVQYAENRFRADLSAGEEALLFSDLYENQCGQDVDQVCALVGERRNYVESRLALFAGDEFVFKALLEGQIKIGVASKLNECTDETYRRYYLDAAVRGGATVAMVTGWIQEWKSIVGVTPPQSPGVESAPAPAAIAETNFFRCAVCRGTEHVHLMRPINVHQHCQLAILDPLLKTYHGEG